MKPIIIKTRGFFCKLISVCFCLQLICLPSKSFSQTNIIPLSAQKPFLLQPGQNFVPFLIKGMTIQSDNPFRFDFIADTGNAEMISDEIKIQSERLIKYFMASLTIPQEDFWVNLSPYESGRIIPEDLAKTDLGRDLLSQDYLLKVLTASYLNPENDFGKEFWKKIQDQMMKKFGTTEIPINTFNKVWIVPEFATIYESGRTVYVVDSKLKVMLEEDYLAMQKNKTSLNTDNIEIAKKEMISFILPEIEREVNQGEHFSILRQIYHSLILADWYKKTILNGYIKEAYINQNITDGIDLQDPEIKTRIYQEYKKTFENGAFNFIKEDYDYLTQSMIPRKYFSGGIQNLGIKQNFVNDRAALEKSIVGKAFTIESSIVHEDENHNIDRASSTELSMNDLNALRPEFNSVNDFLTNYPRWQADHPNHKIVGFLRHGEAASNLFHFNQSYDSMSPPTRRGDLQAGEIPKLFDRFSFIVDRLISSDLERAYLMLEPLAEDLGIPIEMMKRFREVLIFEKGSIPNRDIKEILETLFKAFFDDPEGYSIPGHFSVARSKRSIRQTFDQIALDKNQKKTMISSHGITIALSIMQLLDIDYKKINAFYQTIGGNIGHGSLMFLSYNPQIEDGENPWKLLVLPDDSYLPEDIRGGTTDIEEVKEERRLFMVEAANRQHENEMGNNQNKFADYFPKSSSIFPPSREEIDEIKLGFADLIEGEPDENEKSGRRPRGDRRGKSQPNDGNIDAASLSEPVGGIDLNQLNIKHEGTGVQFHFDQDVTNSFIKGEPPTFGPVIYNVIPLNSILPALGFDSSTN